MKNKPYTHADHIHQHEQEQDEKPAMTSAQGGFAPRLHDEPRPGHHHHTFSLSRDDVRKNRAAMLSREYNQQGSERDSLRHRCHAIINSLEHMEVDKEVALLALEHLVSKGKL